MAIAIQNVERLIVLLVSDLVTAVTVEIDREVQDVARRGLREWLGGRRFKRPGITGAPVVADDRFEEQGALGLARPLRVLEKAARRLAGIKLDAPDSAVVVLGRHREPALLIADEELRLLIVDADDVAVLIAGDAVPHRTSPQRVVAVEDRLGPDLRFDLAGILILRAVPVEFLA